MPATRLSITRESPMESENLPADCSEEEFEKACEFVKKIKEVDEEKNHRGIFLQYTTAMERYQSGSLNVIDLKNRLATIFQNCEVLQVHFDQLSKDLDSKSRQDDVVIDPSKLKRIKEFLKKLNRDCEELRGEIKQAFVRFKEHDDVKILKEEVDMILQDYPCLKNEFRMVLLSYGFLLQDEERVVITREKEDELLEENMFFHAIESAIEFAETEDNVKPTPAVYGAIRRFYKQRRKPLLRGTMKDPKLAVRAILPALKRKHEELLKNMPPEKIRKLFLLKCRMNYYLIRFW